MDDLYILATEKARALIEADAAEREFRTVCHLSRDQARIDRYGRALGDAARTAADLEDRYRTAMTQAMSAIVTAEAVA